MSDFGDISVDVDVMAIFNNENKKREEKLKSLLANWDPTFVKRVKKTWYKWANAQSKECIYDMFVSSYSPLLSRNKKQNSSERDGLGEGHANSKKLATKSNRNEQEIKNTSGLGEAIELEGKAKALLQCKKQQHVVLPTQQMKEPSAIELEGKGDVDSQNQIVVKRKRGRPKGSGKTCGHRDLNSEAVGRPFPQKGPENDLISKEMTGVQTESTQLPSYVVEEHQVPPKILETTDLSRVKDNGGTEDEASTNIQTMGPIVEEHQPLSLCIEKSNPTISGGTVLEDDNNVLTTVQTNCAQLPNPTMADQQTLYSSLENSNPPTLEDTADNQPTFEAMTLTGTSMENLQYNQSSNKAESPHSLKAKGDEIYQSFVDVTVNTHSSPMQEDEVQKPLNNESLPFTKSFQVMWENVESMEVFRLLPQHPHFRPLEKLDEDLREGAAIGSMWSFVSLMKRTCEAQLDDPRSKFENKLEALTGLEDHGFNVQPIRSKLEAMLRIIDRYSQFDNESKAPENELIDEKHQYHEILESIARLDTQLQAHLMEKDKKASKVAELQKMTEEFKEKFQCARLDFDVVRAAPWK